MPKMGRERRSLLTLRLSRSEVQSKYGPTADTKWTPEVEAEFFTILDKRAPDNSSPAKVQLLRDYATDTLKAKRMSGGYLTTLGAVLGKIAAADLASTECVISQRDEQLGPRKTLRTIQAQMEAVGLLVRKTRTQGHGFVGDVFVYRPSALTSRRKQYASCIERSYRATEGAVSCLRDTAHVWEKDMLY